MKGKMKMADSNDIRIRVATAADLPALHELIWQSVRVLNVQDYSQEQLESGLRHNMFDVDRALIRDGTYYVAEVDGRIVGCGGWSFRPSLHNGQGIQAGNEERYAVRSGAAKIRAFYVHPDWARRGIGSRILHTAEAAARRAGFYELELLASLTGVPLYEARGFSVVERVEVTTPDGVRLPTMRMVKQIAPPVQIGQTGLEIGEISLN
jgi:GNAT superfamily N-acetyltransferase